MFSIYSHISSAKLSCVGEILLSQLSNLYLGNLQAHATGAKSKCPEISELGHMALSNDKISGMCVERKPVLGIDLSDGEHSAYSDSGGARFKYVG